IFSPSGELLASGAESGEIHVWDWRRGTKEDLPSGPEAHDGEVRALAFSSDGKWLLSGGAGIVLWHDEEMMGHDEWRPKPYYGPPGVNIAVMSVAISEDGSLLAAGTDDSEVWLWDRRQDPVK